MKKFISLKDADLETVTGILHEKDTQLGFENAVQSLPVQLHCIPNGSTNETPSFVLVGFRGDKQTHVQQISFKMFKNALEQTGFTIKKL